MLADEQLAILKQINSSIAFDGHDRGAADKLVIEGYVQKDGDHLYQLTPFGRCSTIARRVYRHSRDAPQAPVATENASLLPTLRMQPPGRTIITAYARM
jgi:hypothetical protein